MVVIMKCLQKYLIFCLLVGISITHATPEHTVSTNSTAKNACSIITDGALTLTTIWSAVGAAAVYRIAKIPEKNLPTIIHNALNYINAFKLEEKVELEITGLVCIGMSLSAFSLLLLKKTIWEQELKHKS